jgi:hypothetical protein
MLTKASYSEMPNSIAFSLLKERNALPGAGEAMFPVRVEGSPDGELEGKKPCAEATGLLLLRGLTPRGQVTDLSL